MHGTHPSENGGDGGSFLDSVLIATSAVTAEVLWPCTLGTLL